MLRCSYLSITVIFELLSDECIEGVPVCINNITANRPQVTKHKCGTEEWMQLCWITL